MKVGALEKQNKMSVENLATVFGPSMLHTGSGDVVQQEQMMSVDFMSQRSILEFFINHFKTICM